MQAREPFVSEAGSEINFSNHLSFQHLSKNNNAPHIYLIEDAHDSLDAQLEIHQLLKKAQIQFPRGEIFLEGTEGPIQWKSFWNFPDKNAKKVVAHYLLQQGRLSGAELYSVLDPQRKTLFGIESQQAYEENVQAYKALLPYKTAGEKGLTQVRQALEDLNSIYVNPFALKWKKEKRKLQNNSTYLISYLKFLFEWATEVQVAIKPYRQIQELLSFSFSKDAKIPPQINYQIFQEVNVLEEQLFSKIENPISKKLMQMERQIDLFEKIFYLKLSSTEYREYQKINVDEFFKKLERFLYSISSKHNLDLSFFNEWKYSIKLSEDFYKCAKQRESFLFLNLEKGLKQKKLKQAFVVMGGFHAESLKTYCINQGYSFSQISPKIRDFRRTIPYWSLFHGEKLPLESLLQAHASLGAAALARTSNVNDPLFQSLVKALLFSVAPHAEQEAKLFFVSKVDGKTIIQFKNGESIAIALDSSDKDHIQFNFEFIQKNDLPIQKAASLGNQDKRTIIKNATSTFKRNWDIVSVILVPSIILFISFSTSILDPTLIRMTTGKTLSLLERLFLPSVSLSIMLLFSMMFRFYLTQKNSEEEQQAIKSLKELNRIIEDIAANIPGSIYQFKLTAENKWKIPYISEGVYSLLGIEPNQIVSDPDFFIEHIFSEDRDRVKASLIESAETLNIWDKDFRMMTTGGQQRWFRAKAMPYQATEGEVVWNGVLLDVTVFKEASDALQKYKIKLEQSERLASIGLMGAGILHDIKSPLQSTLHFLEMVIDHLEASSLDKTKEELDVLLEELSKVYKIAEQIVNFSKPDSNQMKKFEVFYIHEAIDMAYSVADSFHSRIKINRVYNEDALILGNKIYLMQVFNNLISNSIDAMREDSGVITITVQNAPDNHVQISVIDEGKGIPEEQLGKVFDVFFSTKGQKGTGFGLSNVKKIVESHDGTIQVSSQEGKGTEFRIVLPVYNPIKSKVKAPIEDKAPPVLEDEEQTAPNKINNILFIDDNRMIVKIMESLLPQLFGIKDDAVDAVLSGSEALKLDLSIYDLILLDLTLGDTDGETLARKLRALNQNAIIIFNSGYPYNGPLLKQGVIQGALVKPTGVTQELVSLVEEIVEVRNAGKFFDNADDSSSSISKGSSLGAKQEELLTLYQQFLREKNIIINSDLVSEPISLVFSWETLKQSSVVEELHDLFKRFPLLRIYISTPKDAEQINKEIRDFDPQQLLNEFREWGKKKQFQVLSGYSLQEAKKKSDERFGRGYRGQKRSAVFVNKTDDEEVLYLGSKDLTRFIVNGRTQDEKEGFVLGLPTTALQILQGSIEIPPHIKLTQRGTFEVFAFSLEQFTAQLLDRLLIRNQIAQAA